MKNKKKERRKNFKKIQQTKIHAIRDFPAGIICGPIWGSFAVRDHLRSNLGIICGAVRPLDVNLFDFINPRAKKYFLLVSKHGKLITQPLNYEKISWP